MTKWRNRQHCRSPSMIGPRRANKSVECWKRQRQPSANRSTTSASDNTLSRSSDRRRPSAGASNEHAIGRSVTGSPAGFGMCEDGVRKVWRLYSLYWCERRGHVTCERAHVRRLRSQSGGGLTSPRTAQPTRLSTLPLRPKRAIVTDAGARSTRLRELQ